MRAYVIHQFGGVEQLRLETVPEPAPRAHEVVIRVLAAGLNPIDRVALGGGLGERIRLPAVLGTDISGIVHAVGAEVRDFRAGDAVLGMINLPGSDGSMNGNGFGEFAAAPAAHLVHKPEGLGFEEAAALPAVALTARQALDGAARVTRGQRVLIHGGAGGVGHIAVQLAHGAGAQVLATASGDGLAFVKRLGADDAIDYRTERFEERAKGATLIFDTVGGETLRRSVAMLPPGGTLVTTRWPELASIEAQAKAKGVNASAVAVHADAGQLQELAATAASGALTVAVAEVYPFEQLPAALARLGAGGLCGKLVVRMGT